MKHFALPLLAMALASPVYAQTAPAPWTGYAVGFQFDDITSGELDNGISPIDLDGAQYTFFGSYRTALADTVVLGAEYDLSSSRVDLVGFSGSTRQTVHRLGFELGYAVGRFLPYAGFGISHIRFDGDGGTFTDTGSYTSLGVDYRLNGYGAIGLELNNHAFGTLSGGLALPTTPDLTTIGLSYGISF